MVVVSSRSPGLGCGWLLHLSFDADASAPDGKARLSSQTPSDEWPGYADRIHTSTHSSLPLVIAATLYRHSWFYPAFMIAVGSHYLPFMFLYGMWQFGVLAALLIGSGLVLGLYVPAAPSFGGWLTASLLLIFAFIGRRTALSTPRH